MPNFKIDDFNIYKATSHQHLLMLLSTDGQVEIVKWIYEFIKDHPTVSFNSTILLCSIISGNLELVKFILSINPSIINEDTRVQGHESDINVLSAAFMTALKNGHINICKYLLTIKPDINVSVLNFKAFSTCCRDGHLEAAKWFYQKYPQVSDSSAFQTAYTYSLYYTRLNVSNWLLSIKPDLENL